MTTDIIEKIEGWVFLVSRSQNLGFTTIVAPDFMCDARVSSLLAFVAGGKITEARKAIYRQIHNSAVGNLTLVFRVLETTYEDIGIEGNGKIKDSFGREIPFIEGVVFKGKLTEVKVSEDIFAKIHNDIKQPYQTFWEWSYPKATIPSQSQSFEKPSESECFELIIQEPYTDSPKIDDSSQKIWKLSYQINLDHEIYDFDISDQGDFLAVRFDDIWQTLAIVPFDATNREDIKYNDKYKLEKKHQTFPSKLINKIPVVGGKILDFRECNQSPISISQNDYIATEIVKTNSNYIKIYDHNCKEKYSILIENINHNIITSLSFINKDLIICGCKDGSIKLFNCKTQENIANQNHWSNKQITSIAISSDNKTFASSDSEGNIYFWEIVDLTIYEKRKIQNAHKIKNGMKINSLAFNPDGKILASVGEDDYKIKLWNLSGEEVGILEEENSSDVGNDTINTIVFSSDGKLLASGDNRGYIKIWDFTNKKLLPFDKTTQHDSAVTSLAFIPDTQILISGSKDKTIKFWKQR
ncbi:hypothetical protein H6F39_08880 [Anabaena sp. FACHB-1250]|uniref:WD40 repeat domain-containing protein n=1 Tax=Anabaena sp. FACHB-1250 TaxID=2692770 RepID=UPI00168029D1|nr:hypothetical protein [Anabaena sp. FACHB-1250]MBD2141473.1 hypothetical protein [Anabaena sp. FACHB-1250]